MVSYRENERLIISKKEKKKYVGKKAEMEAGN